MNNTAQVFSTAVSIHNTYRPTLKKNKHIFKEMTNPTNLCNERTVSAVIKSVGMCVSTAIMGVIMYKVFSRLDPNQESKEAAKKRVRND